MRKNKEDLNPTAFRLVEMAKERHKDVERKASKAESENQKRLLDLTVEEKRLKAEISVGKEQLEKMIVEFETLEKEKKGTTSVEAERDNQRNADLKSGKITIKEFVKLKTEPLEDEEEEDSTHGKTPDALDKSSDLVREKATEIVKLELALSNVQCSTYSLILMPIRSLLTSYVQLQDMLNYQLAPLSADGHSSQSEKAQKENELMLIEKQMSISSAGYKWSAITLKDAYRLRLDPIFPKEHVASLIEELNDIEPSSTTLVSITYRQPGHVLEHPIVVQIEVE